MELGLYGWGQYAEIFKQQTTFLIDPVPSSETRWGSVNIGSAPFDGLSTGAYSGSTTNPGTMLAINTPSSFVGRAVDVQQSGTPYFAVYPPTAAFQDILLINTPGTYSGDAINVLSNADGNVYFAVGRTGSIRGLGNISLSSEPSGLSGASVLVGKGLFNGNINGTIYAAGASNGYAGTLMDLHVNDVSQFSVSNVGNVVAHGTVTAGANTAPFPLTNSITLKASDSTMVSNTAFVDGPTVSCVTGTWLLIACCTVVCGTTAGTLTGKLWDGTTVISSSETRQTASQASSITLAGVVSPGSTIVYKMSVATTTGATNASTLKAAAVNNGAGNNATWITAVRIG